MTETNMDYKERCERAEAACAEMRNIFNAMPFHDPYEPLMKEMIAHALSSNCGKGWVSPEQHAHEVGILRAKLLDAEAIAKRWASMAGNSDRQLTLAVEALNKIWNTESDDWRWVARDAVLAIEKGTK